MSAPDEYPTPLDDASLVATWDAAWRAIGRPPSAGLLDELMSAWSEPHRHHHDQGHLRECLGLWARWRGHSERPAEVAIALWFHDAVHDPQASQAASNELGSAAWAARSLVRAGTESDTAQRIHDRVMSTSPLTQCDAPPTQRDAPATPRSDPDGKLLVDIDLSILGSPAARFERYDEDVRRESAWVPGHRYREARAQVLQRFLDRPRLDRPRLYHCEHAVALLERQARTNLAAALSRLSQ